MAARPGSIIWFERLFLAMIVVSIFRWLISWLRLPLQADLPSLTPGLLYAVAIFLASVLIQLLLWFYIARRGSVAAKWILVVLAAINVAALVPRLYRGEFRLDTNGVLVAVGRTLYFFAIAFLFRRDAKPWFDRRSGRIDSDIFR